VDAHFDDRQFPAFQVLLELKVGVGGKQDIESGLFRNAKQFTIQKCAPAQLGCCPDGVWLQNSAYADRVS
jgi:hypothetical protein